MKQTVLIVDDKKINIEMLSSILKDDYRLMAAINGETALKLLQTRKPDIVMLDIFMPGLNGFDVLQYMKSQEKLSTIPVIIVSGEHNVKIEEKGLSMGAVDYIRKPYNATVVRYKVRNHLVFKSYYDELESLVSKRAAQLTASREAIIMGMSLMSESHDPVASGHIERIKYYTQILTDEILRSHPEALTQEIAAQIVLYAPLHDIGKIEIPDKILSKQDILTPEEYAVMQRHTQIGGSLLHKSEIFFIDASNSDDLRIAVEIAENHHERYDGSGYPRGLAGDEIPFSARIVSMVDTYDGLRNKRPYKQTFTPAQAADIILHGGEGVSPSHFDPLLLEVFASVKERFSCESTGNHIA